MIPIGRQIHQQHGMIAYVVNDRFHPAVVP
jgi:hypothetical protein